MRERRQTRRPPRASESEHRLRARLMGLMDASRLITSGLRIDEVLESILGLAMAITEAQASAIFTRADDGHLLFRAHVGGGTTEALRDVRVPMEGSVAGWVATHGQPLRLDEAERDPRFFRDVDTRAGFRTTSILAVPLSCRGRNVGVVEVLNKKGGVPFDPEDQQMLMAMAGAAAAALDNSDVYRRLQDEKQTLDALVDSVPEAILVLNPDGSPRRMNAAAVTLFGGPGPAPGGRLSIFLAGLAGLDREVDTEVAFLKPDPLVLSGRAAPVRGESGELQAIVAALSDVTQSRAVSRRRDELVSVSVHALAGPLEGLVKRLASGADPDSTLARAQEARRGLDDLIRFLDIQAGPVRLLRRNVKLGELLRACLAPAPDRASSLACSPAVRPELVEGERSLADHEIEDHGEQVYADVKQLEEAVRLLLDRCGEVAIPATRLRVTVAGEDVAVAARLRFAGSPEAAGELREALDAERLVERFLSSPAERLDLRLAHARHIVQSHDGTLDVRCDDGEVLVEIALPRARPVPDREAGDR